MSSSSSQKTYLFILSPPYQGSTILLKLLSSSPNISTLLGYQNWAGEGQWLLMRSGRFQHYWRKRWSPKYNINMRKVSEVYHRYWKKRNNKDKQIYCEKSPPNICRANRFKRYFEKKGRVYFISLIRDPYCCRYGAKEWLRYARFQKDNLQQLPPEQHLSLTYEELCDHTETTIQKILQFLPELQTLDPHISHVKGIKKSNDRAQKITNMNRPRNVPKRRQTLQKHTDLLEIFGYHL